MHFLSAPGLAQLPVAAAFGCMVPSALAQCADWRTGASMPGIDGIVSKVLAWDPPGATPVRLVIAGQFRAAGATVISNLALFDPIAATFAPLGAGPNGPVVDAAIQPGTNSLVIVGQFSSAGGVAGTANVARYDGTAWSSVGGGLPGSLALSVAASTNRIFVGGLFGPADAAIAGFNGTTWVIPPASTPRAPNSVAISLATDPAGRVLGIYTDVLSPGAVSVVFNGDQNLAVFNELGRSAFISSLVVRGGEAIVGGWFSGMGLLGGATSPVSVLASRATDGSTPWQQIPWNGLAGFGAGISSLSLLTNGDILLGGSFALGQSNGVALLPGNGTPLQGLLGGVTGVVTSGARLPGSTTTFVVGEFDGAVSGGVTTPAAGFAEFQGASWRAFGTNAGLFGDQQVPSSLISLNVQAMQRFGDGAIAVGGRFEQAAGVTANNVALWRGSWSPLGAGFDGAVQTLLNADGVLFAGGVFTNSGTSIVNRIAQWTGASWRSLGSGVGGPGAIEVRALARDNNRDILVGGIFANAGGVPCTNVARWDVTNRRWRALGAGLLGRVSALTALPNGRILAGGDFQIGGLATHLMEFDGSVWRSITRLNGSVNALLLEPAGTVLVGGSFTSDGVTTLNGIARWDGSAMRPLRSGVSGTGASVAAIARMANGDVLVGGNFAVASGVRAANIARFDGANWSEFGTGTDAPVEALANIDDLAVGVGGRFSIAGGAVRARFATLESTCRPAVAPYTAAGCQLLVADNLPLAGTTFRATAFGVPAGVIAFGAVGLSQVSIPFAVPVATCVQLVSLDLLLAFVPTSSTVAVPLAISSDPSLIGGVLHYQVLYPTFGAGGAITAIAATNALRLTVGSF